MSDPDKSAETNHSNSVKKSPAEAGRATCGGKRMIDLLLEMSTARLE